MGGYGTIRNYLVAGDAGSSRMIPFRYCFISPGGRDSEGNGECGVPGAAGSAFGGVFSDFFDVLSSAGGMGRLRPFRNSSRLAREILQVR